MIIKIQINELILIGLITRNLVRHFSPCSDRLAYMAFAKAKQATHEKANTFRRLYLDLYLLRNQLLWPEPNVKVMSDDSLLHVLQQAQHGPPRTA